MKLEIECSFCKEKFLKRKSEIERTKKSYCSRLCMGKSYKIEKLINKIKLNCLCCGKEFEKRPKENGKFCSQNCAAIVNNSKFPKRKKQENTQCVNYNYCECRKENLKIFKKMSWL